MHLELNLFGHIGATAFKANAPLVLVITLAVILQEYDPARLVVPGVFQFGHFTAIHLLHKFGIRLIIREVYVIAPQVVEVFGERFFGESKNLEQSLVGIHSWRAAFIYFDDPQANACTRQNRMSQV